MKKLHILVPMGKEFNAIGGIANEAVEVVTCGIGKVNAALATAESCLRIVRPDLVMVVGCAGGLDESLCLGDVVVSSSVGYWDVWCGLSVARGQVQGEDAKFDASRIMSETIADILNSGVLHPGARAHIGDIVTGDTFCVDREKVQSIHRDFPAALAVDMESAAVGQVCRKCGIPFVSVRVISDTLNGEREEDYTRFWVENPTSHFAFVAPLVRSLAPLPLGRMR